MRLVKLCLLVWLALSAIVVFSQDDAQSCILDLVENETDCNYIDAISIAEPLEVGQVVLEVSFDPSEFCHSVMILDLTFGDEPQGWMLDIGDSISNNGGGGDAADQSNYAELQIVDNTMSAFGSEELLENPDKSLDEALMLYEEELEIEPGGTLSVVIWDNAFAWINADEDSEDLESEYLFALSGQSDKTGKVNYDLFLAFGRTIRAVDERVGSGITTAVLSLAPSCE